ncbi:hypothetical protein GW17_00060191 [Ensete ventricosum]|nr:hypothetical protein GW17_00060191 [Ensete ventricosum]
MMAEPARAQDQLNERLDFMGLDPAARAALKKLEPVVGRAIGPALVVFYDKLKANPEARKFFADERHMTTAKGLQERHWATIAAADFSQDYVDKVRKIGQAHARIGLEPRLYIGGYAVVTEQLIGAVVKAHWPSLLQIGKNRPQDMADALSSLVKAIFLDMDYAISVYLETLDAQRRAADAASEVARLQASIAVEAIAAALAKLTAKDLTGRIGDDIPDAYAKLRADFNSAMQQLGAAMREVNDVAAAIDNGAREIGTAADDLSRRTEQQAASLEETAAALDEITTTVTKSADGAAHAREVAAAADKDAKQSAVVVRQAVEAMDGIAKSAQEINQIIGVIDEIAFQTNLLALNAGVEAARAGDAGRGFAVVASEVRALAQRSAEAAKEIKSLISQSTIQVDTGVRLVAETGKSLERIVLQVADINSVIGEIALGAREQATGLQQVNTAINQMDQVTQQNAAMVEQTTAASHALLGETSQLAGLVGAFAIGDAKAEAAMRRELRKAAPHAMVKRPKQAAASLATRRHSERAPLKAVASGADAGDEWQEF